jgi:hypothetical protein
MATNVVEWLSLAQTVKRISGRDSWRKTHQPHIMHALKAVSGYATLDVSLASTSIRRIAGCEAWYWQPAVKRGDERERYHERQKGQATNTAGRSQSTAVACYHPSGFD